MGTHIISELFCRTKALTKQKTWWSTLHSKVTVLLSGLKECGPRTHPSSYQQPHPWTVAIKLLIKFSTTGTHSFQGRTLLCTPLPGKAIVCGKQVYQYIFPTAFAHFASLYPILISLKIFWTLPLLYLLWWFEISDLWYFYCNMNCAHRRL